MRPLTKADYIKERITAYEEQIQNKILLTKKLWKQIDKLRLRKKKKEKELKEIE